ncbi:MAG: HlyD family secretion protein [Bacteroidetes bacterium]|nr:MAG: HlyD family secretion protein [Bacteroidota bacterium]
MNKNTTFAAVLLLIMSLLTACNKQGEKADAYGNFEAVQVTVSAQNNGQLLFLNCEEGQSGTIHQVVGLIDTLDLHLKKQQAHSQYAAILSRLTSVEAQTVVQEQQLKNMTVDRDRIYQLLATGAATQKQKDDIDGAILLTSRQLDATRSQIFSIRAEAEVISKQAEQLTEQIRKCYITHPIDGIILTKFAESGEVVTFGKALYKIADLNSLDLKAYISGYQLSAFQIGQEVEVSIDVSKNEYKVLKGTVSWISSTAEFTPKTIQTKEERVDLVYAVKIKVKNDGSLKIGMPGEIRIIN